MQPAATPLERADHEAIAVRGIERRRTIAQRRAQEAAVAAGEATSEYGNGASSTFRQDSGEFGQMSTQQQPTPPRSFTPLPYREQQPAQPTQLPPSRPSFERQPSSSQPYPGYGPPFAQPQPSYDMPYTTQPPRRAVTPSASMAAQPPYPSRQSSLPTTVGLPAPPPMPVPRQQRSLPPENYNQDPGYMPFAPSQQLQQQARQFEKRPRFALVDDGPPADAPVAVRSTSHSSRRTLSQASNGSGLAHRRGYSRENTAQAQEGAYNGVGTEEQPKQATKYTTFAEMGIEGRRAEDKECVIM